MGGDRRMDAPAPDHSCEDPGLTIAEHWARRAATDPEHLYCTFEGERWTIGRMHAHSNRFARLVSDLCPRGTRVALMLANHPDHAAAIFGLMKAGMVRVPVTVSLKGMALSF